MEDEHIDEVRKAYADSETVIVKCIGYDGGFLTPMIPWYLVYADGVIHLCYYDTDGRVYESDDEDDFVRIVKDMQFML